MDNSTVVADSGAAASEQGLVVADNVDTSQQDIPTSTSCWNELRPIVDHYERAYQINPHNRGKVVIFNHKEYLDSSLGTRLGTDADENALYKTFNSLNFTVEIHPDFKKHQILNTLEKERKNRDLDKSVCFIVVVLTHGNTGILHAYDEEYEINLLWENFTERNCPLLKGKPKLFIIQACRGAGESEGVVVTDNITTGKETNFLYTTHVEKDMLIAFGSYDDKVSYRHTKRGSWFIQSLCKQINDSNENDDILSLLSMVSRHVAVEQELEKTITSPQRELKLIKAKQMPVFQSTLTRKLYLKRSDFGNNDWNSLRPSFDVPKKILPVDCGINHVSKVVKRFLEVENERLDQETKIDASMMLMLLSKWPRLGAEMRWVAFIKLASFINENKLCNDAVEEYLETLKETYNSTSAPSETQEENNRTQGTSWSQQEEGKPTNN